MGPRRGRWRWDKHTDFRPSRGTGFRQADRTMARCTPNYAIRLAVEGGGQVKAELVAVGQSGEQSLKRIESAGEFAAGQGRLKGLGRQAELLRTGIARAARRCDGWWPWGADRPLDLGGGCDRQATAQRAYGRNPASCHRWTPYITPARSPPSGDRPRPPSRC